MKIIIGLGNPGDKYHYTRHNIGFRVLDEMAALENLSWKTNKKFNAEVAEASDYMLVKPLTFMNSSGKSVAAILRYYKLIPTTLLGIKRDSDLSSTLIVVHDELDLPFNTFKNSLNSGSAGHNGVQSIIDHVKTKNFRRLRLGISSEARKDIPGDKFVLQKFSADEEKALSLLIQQIISEIKKS